MVEAIFLLESSSIPESWLESRILARAKNPGSKQDSWLKSRILARAQNLGSSPESRPEQNTTAPTPTPTPTHRGAQHYQDPNDSIMYLKRFIGIFEVPTGMTLEDFMLVVADTSGLGLNMWKQASRLPAMACNLTWTGKMTRAVKLAAQYLSFKGKTEWPYCPHLTANMERLITLFLDPKARLGAVME